MRTRSAKSRKDAIRKRDQEACAKLAQLLEYALGCGLPFEKYWRYVQDGRFVVRPDGSFFIATKAVGRARVAAQAALRSARARPKSAS
jgi:hypothetical protein